MGTFGRQKSRDNIQKDKGYHKTKFGYIPNEWKLVQLNEIIESLDAGVSVNSEDRPAKVDEYGVLKTSSVNNGRFFPTENKLIKEKDINRAKLNPVKDSIIISRMNTPELVGEIGFVEADYKNLFLPDRLWQTTFRGDISGKWLANVLILPFFKKQIKNIATGTSNSMKNISKNAFLSLEIPFPSLYEQQYIAKVLSIWDKAIELKEKLIEQKKEQKKGLLQKLFMGHVRWNDVENFSKEKIKKRINMIYRGETPEGYIKTRIGILPVDWSLIKAKKIFKNQTNKNHNGELEVLSATQEKGIVPRSQLDIDIKYDVSSLPNYKKVEKGDFVISLRSFQGGIEYSKYEGIVSPAYTVLKSKIKIYDHFYRFLFKKEDFIRRLNSIIHGIRDGKQIGYKDFGELYIQYPNPDEQKKICEILLVAEKEIEILQKELEKIKQQKKGLMQLLLTGKIRVKV